MPPQDDRTTAAVGEESLVPTESLGPPEPTNPPDGTPDPADSRSSETGAGLAPSSDPVQAGGWIADRYRLIEPLGEGAHGEVWTAHDRVLGEPVALKWMRFAAGSIPSRIRREITTLRMLRIPGVVHLLDDGIAEGRAFVVMERVDGRPFPGSMAPCPGTPPRWSWAAIADTTFALL